MSTATPKPAELLAGLDLDDGWNVVAKLTPAACATGGTFSVAYQVERVSDGHVEVAFLKALDFTIAETMPMRLADALKFMTEAYVFERDLVLDCAGKKMRNVVAGIAAGEITVTDQRVSPPFATVPYIIFERAHGDLRTVMSSGPGSFDHAWIFRVLHGVANGLRQLHQAGIAHQDVKPSNIMTFEVLAKVGDLGRSSSAGGGGLYDGVAIAGDPLYAPPELHYRELQTDDKVRRRACDAYHLGSMIVFMFTGTGLTPLVDAEMDAAFHWRVWPGDYRSALPYVRNAYNYVLARVEAQLPMANRSKVMTLLRELTDPDPLLRGNPKAGVGAGRLAMERYVSRLDHLARQFEMKLSGP